MKRLVTSNEIELVIKKHLQNVNLGSDDFTGVFYQTFKEELMPFSS